MKKRFLVIFALLITAQVMKVTADDSRQVVNYRAKEIKNKTAGIIPPIIWHNVRFKYLFSGLSREETRSKIKNVITANFDTNSTFKSKFRSADICSTIIAGDIIRRRFELDDDQTIFMLIPPDGSTSFDISNPENFYLFTAIDTIYDEIDSIGVNVHIPTMAVIGSMGSVQSFPIGGPDVTEVVKDKDDWEYHIHISCSFAFWDTRKKLVSIYGNVTSDAATLLKPEINHMEILNNCVSELVTQIIQETPF